jgi:tripartite ATP-independent transporter DctP family solute receptor
MGLGNNRKEMGHMLLKRTFIGATAAAALFAGGAQAQVTLKAAHTAAPSEPFQAGFDSFASELAKANSGIKVEIFPNAQLGDESSVIKSMQSGGIAVSTVSNSPLAEFVPELHLFDLPFLFRDRAHAYKVVDGPIGHSFDELCAAKGLVLLGFWEAGIRNILNSVKPINALADFKGMKIRVIPSSINLDTFRALGANPVPIQYSQLYVALQNKTVDAAEAANSNYEAKKFYEVAPYYAEVEWQILIAPLLMSKKVYDGLTPAQQKAVMAAAKVSTDVERKAYQDSDDVSMKKLLAAGVKVSKPDRKPWMEAVKPVLAQWAPKVGEKKLADIAAAN